jgi:hypothetical protein
MENKVVISKIYEIAVDSSEFYGVLSNHWPIVKLSYDADRERNYLKRIIMTGNDNFVAKWNISYQKTFIFKLSDGREIRFDTTDGDGIGHLVTNAEVGRDIMKFIDEFNQGKFEYSQLEVANEVEFMDI